MTAADPGALRIFLRGSPSLRGNLLSADYGGDRLEVGIVEAIGQSYPQRAIEVAFEECEGAESLAAAMTAGMPTRQSRMRDFAPDLVVLSVDADLLASTGSWNGGMAEAYESNMLAAIRAIKEGLGSRVIMLNASSVVPNEAISNYRMAERPPRALDAHRLNLATMRLSLEEGISIVDVDRIIAELGGAEHVVGFLDYSPVARKAICSEFIRVVEEYGFFDNRPLLPQVGKSSASTS